MNETIIFTDGASRGNPGPGGWGTILIQKEEGKGKKEDGARIFELGGKEENTTNNRMELRAAIEGLEHAGEASKVTIYTDSSYLINGITKWIHGWHKNDWKTKTKEDVLNKDLWMELFEQTRRHEVIWKYVGGHVGVAGNERCDRIATDFADGKKVELYRGPLADYSIPNILNISHDAEKFTVKSQSSSRSRAPAYSYVSKVDGKIEIHKTWPECEARVKGKSGARFKKAVSADDEKAIIAEFTS